MKLRPFAKADWEDVIALHRDPRVTALLIDTVPDGRFLCNMYLHWTQTIYAKGDAGPLHASLRDTGAFAGSFSLVRDEETGLLELGGRLYPQYWGSGLAMEGGAALVDHAFGKGDEAALCSLGHPDNRAIDFVLARLGFHPVRFREALGQRAIEWVQKREDWSLRGRRPLDRRAAMKIAMNRRNLRDDP